jgi:hypothetical protein
MIDRRGRWVTTTARHCIAAAALVVAMAGGCGRYEYDPLAVRDGSVADAAAADGAADGAADDAALARETWTFGEVPGATVGGVTADTLMCDGGSERNLNWGAFRRFDGGPFCTGLLRFDLTALPAGITVVDASVAVWPELVPSVEGQVDVHRVLEAWDEGDLMGSPGVASYLERQPGIAWTTTGARPPGSSDATPLHSFHPGVLAAQIIPLPVDVVAGWIADPTSNHGIAFFGSEAYGDPDGEHPHFLSSEHSSTGQRPLLTITFDRP